MIWGWDARADYVARTLPQTNFGVSFAKSKPDDRNLNSWVALGSFVSGVKVSPDKRASTKINKIFDAKKNLEDELDRLNQLGVFIDGRPVPKQYKHLIPKYKRLNDKKKRLEEDLFGRRKVRGDKLSPKDPGRPPKGRRGSGGDPLSGSRQTGKGDPLLGGSTRKPSSDPLFP
jgi:hypothetical protein